MREIKFRAWDKINKEMIYSHLKMHGNKDMCLVDFWEWVVRNGEYALKDKACVVQQYIELKDKNDKEIYEGDIVKRTFKKKHETVEINYEIKYGSCANSYPKYTVVGCFILSNSAWTSILTEKDIENCEVVGNIFETPELLK